MKLSRHKAILEIIDREEICTQESLLEKLKNAGYDVTQATISRDIKTLDLIKTAAEGGGYMYVKKPTPMLESQKNNARFRSVFVETVIEVDYALNTVVLKCHVGMGNAACAALDTMEFKDIVGTIAGDDTIFVLLRTEAAAARFVEQIRLILKSDM